MKSYRKYFLTFFVSCSLSLNTYALVPFSSTYSVKFGPINIGNATIKMIKTSDKTYRLTLSAKTSGFIEYMYPFSLFENSELELLDNGRLRSMGYLYQEKKNNKLVKNRQVVINYNEKKAWKLEAKDSKQWDLQTDIPTDKLSFPFIIADDLNKKLPQRIPITVLDGRQNRIIYMEQLEIKNSDPINYSGKNDNYPIKKSSKNKDTLHYKLEHDDEEIYIWLDKKNRHIPTRIKFVSDGWAVHYRLKKITWNNE